MPAMRLTWRDGVATVFVVALMVVYAEFLARHGLGLVADPRGMGSVGLISTAVLCPLGGSARSSAAWTGLMSLVGVVTLALGVVTVITLSWTVLAAFMIAIAAMWALATIHHALGTVPAPSPTAGAVHA
jgi:hypothetical protein